MAEISGAECEEGEERAGESAERHGGKKQARQHDHHCPAEAGLGWDAAQEGEGAEQGDGADKEIG